MMLIEEGFSVTSCDFSDKMLKGAWNTRWNRRKEAAFDNWGTNRTRAHGYTSADPRPTAGRSAVQIARCDGPHATDATPSFA